MSITKKVKGLLTQEIVELSSLKKPLLGHPPLEEHKKCHYQTKQGNVPSNPAALLIGNDIISVKLNFATCHLI
jgi:hypothetical protein